MDAGSVVANALATLGVALGYGVWTALLLRATRVRRSLASWSLPALAVYCGWVLLVAGTGLAVHALTGGLLDEPWRKLLAGGAAMLLATATTRPAERLILRLSRGRAAFGVLAREIRAGRRGR